MDSRLHRQRLVLKDTNVVGAHPGDVRRAEDVNQLRDWLDGDDEGEVRWIDLSWGVASCVPGRRRWVVFI